MLCVCVTTTFSAWGKPSQIFFEINKNDEPHDTEKNRDPVPDNDVTYSFLSGNSNACYVNKASKSTKPSTFWFCGKTTPKCDGNGWFGQDTVYTLEDGKKFTWANTEYYCCGGDAKTAGTFKEYQAPTEKDEKYSVGGGTCIRTIKVDVCGKTSVVKPCSVPTECPSGKVVHNKECVLKCPSGQHFESDTSNKCVADKLNCSGTQVERNGKCVEKCTGGKDFESATSDKCVCGSGMVEIGGNCEAKKSCGNNEEYVAATNTCKEKQTQGSESKPPVTVEYDFSSYDDDSCYVKKPKTGNGEANIWYCGKEAVTKTCAHNAGNNFGSKYLEHNETFDYDGKTYRCCEGIVSERAGFFSTRTEMTKRYELKDVPGGKCIKEIEVDLCGTKTLVKDCDTPDSKLSVSGKTVITKSNMQECGLCTVKDDFKTCVINSCYERDADEKACTSKLKKACSIKK